MEGTGRRARQKGPDIEQCLGDRIDAALVERSCSLDEAAVGRLPYEMSMLALCVSLKQEYILLPLTRPSDGDMFVILTQEATGIAHVVPNVGSNIFWSRCRQFGTDALGQGCCQARRQAQIN